LFEPAMRPKRISRKLARPGSNPAHDNRPMALAISFQVCGQPDAFLHFAWEWMGPGGSRGLQNRCGAVAPSWEGSTPSHSRHISRHVLCAMVTKPLVKVEDAGRTRW